MAPKQGEAVEVAAGGTGKKSQESQRRPEEGPEEQSEEKKEPREEQVHHQHVHHLAAGLSGQCEAQPQCRAYHVPVQ